MARVQKIAAETSRECFGAVAAATASTLQSKVMGHLVSVTAAVGDTVEQGQVLAELDARDFEAQARQAQSALDGAKQAQQEVENTLQAAVHAREGADAAAALAKATFNRFAALLEQKAVTKQAYDEADARNKSAEADAARAAEAVKALEAGRDRAVAGVAQAQAEVDKAQTFLGYTKIAAPFAGIVTKKFVNVGDLAAPGAPLFSVESGALYRFEAMVDESLAQQVKLGDAVHVTLDGVGGDAMVTAVSEMAPSADVASRSFIVKMDLPAGLPVKSGMSGRARFASAATEMLAVPETAIARRGQLEYVFVVEEGKTARLRLITTGKRSGGFVEALSGVNEGDSVVTGGLEQVSGGAPVTLN